MTKTYKFESVTFVTLQNVTKCHKKTCDWYKLGYVLRFGSGSERLLVIIFPPYCWLSYNKLFYPHQKIDLTNFAIFSSQMGVFWTLSSRSGGFFRRRARARCRGTVSVAMCDDACCPSSCRPQSGRTAVAACQLNV